MSSVVFSQVAEARKDKRRKLSNHDAAHHIFNSFSSKPEGIKIQNSRKNNILEDINDQPEPNQNSFNRSSTGLNNMSSRAQMIMKWSQKINGSKKRNMNDFMSQGILEVEKVMNNSQHYHSIPDDQLGEVDEAAELNKALNLKYGDKIDEE